MNDNVFISLEASEAILLKIKESKLDGVLISEPILMDSPSDVLDAPINYDDVVNGASLVKIIFQTGTAALTFSIALVKLLKEKKDSAKITSQNGEKKVDSNTSPEEVQNFIKK